MTETRETTLRRFFERFAKASLEGDIETLAAAYAPTYIEAAPDSFSARKVDESYREALKARHARLHDQLGLSGLELDIREICEAAPSHFLVKADLKMTFSKARAGKVTSHFPVNYIARIRKAPEILAHVASQSETEVMRRDGVI